VIGAGVERGGPYYPREYRPPSLARGRQQQRHDRVARADRARRRAAVDTSVRARLDLLLDDRAHPVQATVLVLAAVAVLVLPTMLVVLPWLAGLAD
jgi:hypothetical protein